MQRFTIYLFLCACFRRFFRRHQEFKTAHKASGICQTVMTQLKTNY